MSDLELLSREEVLGGLTARRAQTLLYLIESRTAHLVASSQQALNPFLTAEGERQRDLVFLQAFALGREPPLKPTIQDLERYAPEWRVLVPDNVELRAVIAHLLADRFVFTHASVPRLRAALALDDAAVQRAYARRYGQPPQSIYQPRVRLAERLRWSGASFASRLESLPPFWTVFSLTLTETVGSGILALPIALASIGPLPGLVILILLGLANVLTIAALAESLARTGSVRYGNAFFGRLVYEYLGRAGSTVVILALAGFNLATLLGYYIGLSSALSAVTWVRSEIWIVLLFGVGLYFLSRGSLRSTITSALVVGAVNMVMVLLLVLLAFAALRTENLTYANVPLLNGRPFEPAIFGLIFGVVLSAYFGHSSVGNCGKLVLKRDPSARSLIWGTVAAQLTAIVLYCVWLLAVGGAIPAQTLASEKGTALAPLADTVGPLANVFGLVLVVLGMGMGSIHSSLGLFSLVRERLPESARPVLLLLRGRSRLRLHPRRPGETPSLTLTYLGLAGRVPKFALDRHTGPRAGHQAFTVADHWQDAESQTQIDVLDASADHVRLQVTSTLAASVEEQAEAVGVHLLDVLLAPGAEPPLVRWLLRHGAASLAEVAESMGQDQARARAQLTMLIEQGMVQEERTEGETRYRVRLARRGRRTLPAQIWQALDPGVAPPPDKPSGFARFREWVVVLLSARASRFWLSASPIVLVLLIAEWLTLTNSQSFTWVLNLGGVLAAPIFAGVFPALVLASSRRKGNVVPQVVYRFIGHPLVLVALYGLFLSSLFVHGLFIWQGVPERAAALLAGLIVLGVTVYVLRRGALKPRVVVEWRQEGQDRATYAVIARGALVPARVSLHYRDRETPYQAAEDWVSNPSSLRGASFEIDTPARELQVWAHQVTPEGDSTPLPACFTLSSAAGDKHALQDLSAGPVLVPWSRAGGRVRLFFQSVDSTTAPEGKGWEAT
ncbi:MAG: hypothetical protein JXM73_26260 [Anaerolineae bacterium]|nr:hypothetical protein [Anaerolineae bacterium]